MDGNVIDSPSHVRNRKGSWDGYKFFQGHHMDLKAMTYHTWALDGDSNKRKISVVHETQEMSKDEKKEEYLRMLIYGKSDL